MNKRVVITGMGVITPVGNTVDEFWSNLTKGVCGIDYIDGYEEFNLPIKIAGQVKEFHPEQYNVAPAIMRKCDRYCQYALAAASQAMEQSGLKSGENIQPGRLGVYVGSGIGGLTTIEKESQKLFSEGVNRISPLFIPMMIANIAAGNIAIQFSAEGPCLPVVTACATGTHSIGEAYHAIKHGYADAVISGGAEASIHPIAIGGFNNSKALSRNPDPKKASIPFDKRRDGFVIGEGAGILVLEEYEHAKKRGANIIAEVCGYGNTCDAYHYTAPRPDGSVAANAIKASLDEAGFKAGENLYINAHGTSTPLNDKTETAAIKLALGEDEARKANISSTKSMTGHMLGATGGVEMVVCAMALRDGIVPPTIGLEEADPDCDLDYTPGKAKEINLDVAISNSLGFGGHNSCVALRKYKAE